MTRERIREYFARDRYAALTGIEILEVREGYAKTHLKVEDKHLNGNNVVMGGCIYTMADFTFALAANCGESESITLNSSIVFMNDTSFRQVHSEEPAKDHQATGSCTAKNGVQRFFAHRYIRHFQCFSRSPHKIRNCTA